MRNCESPIPLILHLKNEDLIIPAPDIADVRTIRNEATSSRVVLARSLPAPVVVGRSDAHCSKSPLAVRSVLYNIAILVDLQIGSTIAGEPVPSPCAS